MASDMVRDGVFAINKPCGQSSAQIIRECQQHFNPSAFFRPVIEAERARRLKEHNGQFKRRKLEKKASQVKIGHGGTLDPLATGVLILGIGSGTKQLSQFLDCTKTYEAIVLFGATTDSYDRVGRIISKRPYDHITRKMVQQKLENFKGKQLQIPPLFSALKMNGKPLYEYAREGRPIPREIEGREVEALEMELLEWYEPGSHAHRWPTAVAEAAERNLAEQVWKLKKPQNSKHMTPEEKEEDEQAIEEHESFKRRFEERQDELIFDRPSKRQRCSHKPFMSGALDAFPQPTYSSSGSNLVPPSPDKQTPPPWKDEGPPACKIRLTVTSGYYVRSFCHDLGAKLGSGGIMAELCRVRQGDFTVGGDDTLAYEELAKGEEVWGPRVADMLAHWNGGAGRDPTAPATVKREQSSPQRGSIEQPDEGPSQAGEAGSPSSHKQPAVAPSPGKDQAHDASPGTRKASQPDCSEPDGASSSSQKRSDDETSWNGIAD